MLLPLVSRCQARATPNGWLDWLLIFEGIKKFDTAEFFAALAHLMRFWTE
jgi:hypothetical protein